ncbi:MAG: LssY C-terminal domain-containing protein [Deltaproteobacteria bacterium]|nr:LssY C-terminal domain-containing protein [Candidatus Desulfobacula maris]MBL6995391.1 LssY C-terminal domain-containing protein [Desulfobacula sp.]
MVWGYWIGFSAALLETTLGIGLILPGSTIVLLLGAMCARGYLEIGNLIGFAASGAIIGDNINYYIGKKYGARWLKNGFWLLTAIHIEKAKYFMDNHGAKSVFIGRFIPSVKEIVPFIAGSIKMDFKTFMLWNILGAIGWGCEWVLAGFIFAQSLNLAELWLSRAGLFFAFLLILGVVFTIFRWLIIRNEKRLLTFFSILAQAIQEALTKNKVMRSLLQKYPRTSIFLKARFDTTVFSGLTLSLLILAFVYVLALFAGVVEDLLTLDPIIAADIRIANLFSVFRTDRLNHIFTWITLLGKSEVILAFLFVSTALLWVWRKKHFILPLFISVAGSEVFTYLGKLAFHRPRPEMAVYAEQSFSFPSGHATIAVAFYGFATYLLIRAVQGWNKKVNIFFAGFFFAMAIGFSRVYLGVHYISDVWSGYLVGAMWLIIAISFCEWLRHEKKSEQTRSKETVVRSFTFLFVFLAVFFYVVFAMTYHPPLAPVLTNHTVIVSNSMDVFVKDQIKYTETIIGDPQEPVNFVFLAKNDSHLVSALAQAGWHLTDKSDLPSFITAVKALILKTPHPQAPIAPSFWNAKTQDMGFAKLAGSNWLTDSRHLKIWRSNALLTDKTAVYVGMANANDGFKWYIIPKINPDLDTQRELLYMDLNCTGKILDFRKQQLVSSQTGKNFTGDPFFSDGQVYVISVQ